MISDSITVSVNASPQESIRQLSLTFAGEEKGSLENPPFEFGTNVSYSFAYNESYRFALHLQTITGTSNPQ